MEDGQTTVQKPTLKDGERAADAGSHRANRMKAVLGVSMAILAGRALQKKNIYNMCVRVCARPPHTPLVVPPCDYFWGHVYTMHVTLFDHMYTLM